MQSTGEYQYPTIGADLVPTQQMAPGTRGNIYGAINDVYMFQVFSVSYIAFPSPNVDDNEQNARRYDV